MKQLCKVFLLLVLPLSIASSSSAVARDNPFPRFSIGTAGLIHYLDNELIRDVLIDNDYGLMTGLQFDADLRVLYDRQGGDLHHGEYQRTAAQN